MAYIECVRQYVAVFYLLNLIVYSMGEGFFRERFRHDLDLYELPKKPFHVTRQIEAEEMLLKYGFMKCKTRRKRSTGIDMDDFVHEKITERYKSEWCDPEKLRQAIIAYQKEFDLPVTGVLTQREFDHMSQQRCGNVDVGEELVANTRPELILHDGVSAPDTNVRRKRDAGADDQHGENIKIGLSQRESDERKNSGHSYTNIIDLSRTRPWHKEYVPPHRGSLLIKALTPRPPISPAMERRRKYLRQYLERLKSEPLDMSQMTELRRRKRSPVFNSKTHPSQMFTNGLVRWRVLDSGYSKKISTSEQQDVLRLAFRIWSEIIPIVFIEDLKSHIADVDIEIAFGRKEHVGCLHDFDGNGGEVAHSWHVGNMHFDDDERYRTYDTNSFTREGIYLLRVAVHEIGHVLGLSHKKSPTSVMFPIYIKTNDENFELHDIDRTAIAKIYGPCKGTFNLVMDWVRQQPGKRKPVFNTYFFRKKHYWLYDNHFQRTRYGDPLMLRSEWKGVPDNLDAYVHVFYKDTRVSYVSFPYFFKDDLVYLYNSSQDQVEEGWPRKINDIFNRRNSTDGVPNNLDTAVFDYRDTNIYFFKDDLVYVYNPKQTGNDTGCCERIVKLSDEFPTAPGHKPLPSQLDAAYFSFKKLTMFFFKGDDVWRNVLFNMRQRVNKNLIHYIGNWSDHWHYICDTAVV